MIPALITMESIRTGIRVKLFFGGGEPSITKQAKNGPFLPLQVFDSAAELFAKDRPIPPDLHRQRVQSLDE